MPIHFSWDVPDGFEISPPSSSLFPKQTCKLTATFRPSSAVIYSAAAVCNFSSKVDKMGGPYNQEEDCVKKKLMKLEGIGKYPYILVKLCSGKKTASVPKSRRRIETFSVCETPVTSSAENNASVREEIVERESEESGYSFGVAETLVDFGEVAVGNVVKKKIELTNVSPVSAHSIHFLVLLPLSLYIPLSLSEEAVEEWFVY